MIKLFRKVSKKDDEEPVVHKFSHATNSIFSRDISQDARQNLSPEKTPKPPKTTGFCASPETQNVAFLSKSDNENVPHLRKCADDHVSRTEKITSPCPWTATAFHDDPDGFRAHVDQLTKMQARALYQDEATSHRNIKGRAIIDPAFNDFRSFLRHVRPKPTSTATIDRIDTLNPTYGPGLVAWADKKTQSTNRSCVHLIRSTGTNEVVTTRQLAKRQGKSASTIRKRLERGWTPDQIIAGKRAKALSDPLTTADDPPKQPSVSTGRSDVSALDLESVWIAEVHKHHKFIVNRLSSKERGMLKSVAEVCPEGKADRMIAFIVEDWIKFAIDVKAKKDLKSAPNVPDVGFLSAHAHVAVNLYSQEPPLATLRFEVEAAPKAKFLNALELHTPKEPTPKAPKMTKEELMAILGGPGWVKQADRFQSLAPKMQGNIEDMAPKLEQKLSEPATRQSD